MKASAALLEHNRINAAIFKAAFAGTDGERMPCADFTDLDPQNAHFEGNTQKIEFSDLFV